MVMYLASDLDTLLKSVIADLSMSNTQHKVIVKIAPSASTLHVALDNEGLTDTFYDVLNSMIQVSDDGTMIYIRSHKVDEKHIEVTFSVFDGGRMGSFLELLDSNKTIPLNSKYEPLFLSIKVARAFMRTQYGKVNIQGLPAPISTISFQLPTSLNRY
jgi:light-regulated signal transduction histidine kinase (bacteriophytochrome)